MECENHPDERAVATCVACGASICEECLRTVEDEPYCLSCAEDMSVVSDEEDEEGLYDDDLASYEQ